MVKAGEKTSAHRALVNFEEEYNMNYFPFGFARDPVHPDADQMLERLEKRIAWLNECHKASGMEGHFFAAAVVAYVKTIPDITVKDSGQPTVWELLMSRFSVQQIAALAKSLAGVVSKEKPRLEFPNAVALVDCRFVTRNEWEFLRRYSIGGSEVAAIMGVSHYATPRKIFHDKRGEIPKVEDINRDYIFDYGHQVEDVIVERVCEILGAVHYPEYRMFCHKDYPFITANPDALLWFPNGELALFEAKTATRHIKDDWAEGIPDYYAPQPQQYLEVLNDPRLEKGYIGVMFGGLPSELKAHLYQRDREMAQRQIQEICHYWHTYQEPAVLPPLLGNPKLDLQAVYCTGEVQAVKEKIELPPEDADEFREYFSSKESRAKIQKEANKIKEEECLLLERILELQPVDETVLVKKEGSITYRLRRQRRGTEKVDTTKLPEEVQKELLAAAQRSASPSLGYTNAKINRR